MTPDTRRMVRSLERAVSALAALGLLAFIVSMLTGQSEWLGWIAMGLIVILGLREFMVGSENVAARIEFSASKDGLTGKLDSEKTQEDLSKAGLP